MWRPFKKNPQVQTLSEEDKSLAESFATIADAISEIARTNVPLEQIVSAESAFPYELRRGVMLAVMLRRNLNAYDAYQTSLQ
jgi:hypothetical protein